MIYVAFAILAVAIGLVLLYTVKNLASRKGELKKTFISLGAFFGVILIAFIFADNTPVTVAGEEFSSTTSKMVSTGLITFYIVAVIAVGLMFFTGYNRIKK